MSITEFVVSALYLTAKSQPLNQQNQELVDRSQRVLVALGAVVDFCSQDHFMSDLAADSALPIETDTRNLGWGLKQQEKTSDHG